MSWVTLTQDDLLAKLTAPELTAVKTKALAEGQENPVPEELANCIQEIRGRVAACGNNTLGAGATIPHELVPAALAILRFRVLSRLPISTLITPAREREYNDALSLLKDVAACRFSIEQPETETTQKISGPTSPLLCARPRQFTRNDQDGA